MGHAYYMLSRKAPLTAASLEVTDPLVREFMAAKLNSPYFKAAIAAHEERAATAADCREILEALDEIDKAYWPWDYLVESTIYHIVLDGFEYHNTRRLYVLFDNYKRVDASARLWRVNKRSGAREEVFLD